jgi:hypothetical protein
MHFYLLRGTKSTKTVNRKIIAHSDIDAKANRRALYLDIAMTELLACEVINWSSPSSTKLHKGHFYLVIGQRTTYEPTATTVDVEEKVEATCDEEAAYTVSRMYRDHKIEKAQLLRCRVVEKGA